MPPQPSTSSLKLLVAVLQRSDERVVLAIELTRPAELEERALTVSTSLLARPPLDLLVPSYEAPTARLARQPCGEWRDIERASRCGNTKEGIFARSEVVEKGASNGPKRRDSDCFKIPASR
jgi:hypothetical protein